MSIAQIPSMVTPRSRLLAFMLITSAMSMACEKEELVRPFKTYTIAQGGHDAKPRPVKVVQGTRFHFIARFDSSAIYSQEEAQPRGVNKLRGFSDCGSTHHHDNSARFGWEWIDGKLVIYGYVYANGERKTEAIGSVPLNQDVTYSIESGESEYVFTYSFGSELKTHRMKRGCGGKGGVRYLLHPYFGGQAKAPRDITIQIMD